MGGGKLGRLAGAALMLLTAPACPSATYQCSEDGQCPEGSCIERACAFADDACASGMRFGPYSAGGVGGMCVPIPDGTTTVEPGTGPASSSSSSTSLDSLGTTSSESSSSTTATDESSTTGEPGMTTTTGAEESSSTGPLPDPDLVAWFPCDADGESIGLDASGNGHDGTCTSCPSSAPGVVGQACAFEPGQSLAVPFDAAFSVEELTLAAWLLPDALPDDRLLAAAGVPVGANEANAYQFGFNGLGTGELVFFCSGSVDNQACINESVVTGDWIHVAVTSSADGIRMYFDGMLVREGPFVPFGFKMQDFLIGQDIDNGEPAHEYSGRIDELRLYSRALTDDEVTELATP